MSRKTKGWLIAAVVLVLAGLVLMVGVITACNRDFTKLSTVQYETNTYEISEEFRSISIHTDTADLFFVPSEDDKCRVVCYEETTITHPVTVPNGTLTIHQANTRKWYDNIGFSFGTPSITVFLPAGEYDNLLIKESTGDIEISKDFQFEAMDITTSTGDVTNYASASDVIKISTNTGYIHTENISADMLDLSVSTGNVTVDGAACEGDIHIRVSTGKANLTNVTCKNFYSDGNTGDLTLNNAIAAQTVSIARSTGDVIFDGCDAAELSIQTDTGDVEGTLRSDKVFFITTDTGDVDVPRTMTGGRCEISTDTGDITLDIK